MNPIYYKNQVIHICSEYAGVAHMGQFRKDKTTPYVIHPARVACLTNHFLRNHLELYLYLSAAWLHDVMEDCSEIIDKEYSRFIQNHKEKDRDIYKFLTEHDIITAEDGANIFRITEFLTVSQDKSIPKKMRKKTYFKAMRKEEPEISVVKYCDRIDNLSTAHIFTKNGFLAYLEETKTMMKKLGLDDVISLSAVHIMLVEQLKGAKDKYKEMYG